MHRFEGHWWSPDDRWLAYTRVDTAPVAESRRPEIAADRIEAVTQRYPYAGGTNAEVRLALVPVGEDGVPGDSEWVPWDTDGYAYLARVAFAPGGSLLLQLQTRDQTVLAATRYEPGEGRFRPLFEETADTWVNLHDNLVFTGDGDAFLWTSERGRECRPVPVRRGTRPCTDRARPRRPDRRTARRRGRRHRVARRPHRATRLPRRALTVARPGRRRPSRKETAGTTRSWGGAPDCAW